MLNGMDFLMTFTFDVVQVRPEARSSEFISGRLFNATLYLDGRAKVESFIGAYTPTATSDAWRENVFWVTLDRAG